jgi:hypothetical protein
VAENARLRRELEAAREQLASWRELLLEHDLVEPTPREALGASMSFWEWPPLRLGSGRWIGGCEHAWGELLCHGLTDAEVDEALALDGDEGLDHGGDPDEMTADEDPRCAACRTTTPAVSPGGGAP